MSEPTPEPVTHPGFIAHIEQWVREHVVPELEAIRADAQKAVTALPAALAGIEKLAGIVTTLAKLVDPAAGPEIAALVAEAERIAEEVTQVAEEVLGSAA